MNPRLGRLQPYPFDRLRALLSGVSPAQEFEPVNLSIGEPKHTTPAVIRSVLSASLDGLSAYPATAGLPILREAISSWLQHRYGIPAPDPAHEILPVNGSREALFAFAQAVIDPERPRARVVCPNPFYQIYEGAALLAGAEPVFLNTTADSAYRMPLDALGDDVWRDVQLVYACSPANPSGTVMAQSDWDTLFALSDRYGFVIASDECYSELYYDEALPPLGALQAAHRRGRDGYPRLVVFSSLSKRSNAPGLRSGFVAGDRTLIAKFLLYRTYHGSAMSQSVQHASAAAWSDEAHVVANRALYRDKYRAVLPRLDPRLGASMPDGGFYLWLSTPDDDASFARGLYRDYNVLVLPGSYLARTSMGVNPGAHHVRVALVAPLEQCVSAADRINRHLISH